MVVQQRGAERARRAADFRYFRHVAKAEFDRCAREDRLHKKISDLADLCVVLGSRDGPADDRIVDVFYRIRTPAVDDATSRGPTESGEPRLEYVLQDDAAVLCWLYPPKSNSRPWREDAILLAQIREPKVLTGWTVLGRHRRALQSYFEVRGVDGRPTINDRLRIWWLLFTRQTIVKGHAARPVWLRALKWAVVVVLVVGLSGWLAHLLQ